MMRVYLAGALVLGLATAGAAQAESVDLDFSQRAVHGAFDGNLANVFPRLSGVYEIGGLGGSIDSDSYRQGHIGFLVTGDAGAQQANVTAGLGARLAALDNGPIDGGELSLGGVIEARLPAFNRIGARGYIYAAPRASSFGDLHGYIEWAADADYQVLRNASIYAGYHELIVNAKTYGSVTVDTGFHLGLRLNF